MDFLYFDCVGGAAGDMILAALTDGLVPLNYLQTELEKLNMSGWRLESQRVFRHHIDCHKLNVIVRDESHPHRHLSDILDMIDQSALSPFVKKESSAIFTRLGEQEARAHRMALEKVHFHEVGAQDSIIDIVGCCIALDYLKPQKIYTSPLPVGLGTFKAAHGVLPSPAPATLGLIRDYPLRRSPENAELVTPTGAALITHFSAGPLPEDMLFTIQKHGTGAGDKDFKQTANFLRVWQGRSEEALHAYNEIIREITCDVDDMSPQHFPFVMDLLLENGALDVSMTSIIMKQGRPGIRLTVLCPVEQFTTLSNVLFQHTTTIGVRYQDIRRRILERCSFTVDSPWGNIEAKKIIKPDGAAHILPEYRSCRKLAEKHRLSLQEIRRMLESWLNRPDENT